MTYVAIFVIGTSEPNTNCTSS